jgi:hypothetical protein
MIASGPTAFGQVGYCAVVVEMAGEMEKEAPGWQGASLALGEWPQLVPAGRGHWRMT